MATEELKLVITVDKEGAISGIKQVQDAEKVLQTETKNTQTSFTELNAVTELLSKGLEFAKGAFSAVVTAIKQGSAIDDVSSAFGRLADNAGTTAEIFLKDLNAATGGTISNFNLMRQANEALQKGLTPEQFTTISAAARELSDTLGTDLNQEMQQLSQALETGNAKILQNKIGIVDLKAAEEEYAKGLGIKTEQLTREQQVMSARTAIMSAMSDEAERGIQIEADNADLIEQVTVGLNNQVDALQKSLGSNKELNAALIEFRDNLAKVDFKSMIEGLTDMATTAVKAVSYVINSFNNLKQNIQLVSDYLKTSFNSAISDTSQKAAALNAQFLQMTATLSPTSENIKKAKDILTQLSTELRQTRAEAAKNPDANLGDLADAAAESNDEMRDLIARLSEYESSAIDTVAVTDDASIKVDKLSNSVNNLKNVMGGGVSAGSTFNKSVVQATRGIGPFADPKKYGKALEDQASGKLSMFDQFFGTQIFGVEEMKKLGDALEQVTAQAVGTGLRLAFEGGNSEDWKQLTKQTGAGVGQALGESAGGPIGAAIGEFIGEKAGKALFDGFNHIFGGGRDPGTRTRKNIEAWFDNLLKDADLQIIKEDQLMDLKDFDRLGDAFEENWAETFQAIAGESTNTFSMIGQGLTGIIGVSEEFGSQIAYIMAENLGGSLNNLQLLFQKTGLSAEELKNKLLESFIDGKLSADDFVESLSAINQVMTEGIPDGVGMTGMALDNLFASTGRGLPALDALKDIFIEAGEVGISTFKGLKDNLIAAGQSAEQVDALFKVLSDAEINSFDQVTSGSDEFLIGLIANLDNAGFQFAELNQTIDDLGQKLDDLERGRDIDIRLNVTTNADAGSQRLINAGALPGVA